MSDETPTAMAPDEGRDAEAEALEQIMDDGEAELADRLREIAIEHKRAFKERVRDRASGANSMNQARERLRDRFLPKYEAAVREVMQQMRAAAQEITVEHNDWAEIVDPDQLPGQGPTRNEQFEDAFRFVISDLAKEIYQRNDGVMADDATERERQRAPDGEAQRKGISRLSDGTLQGAANKSGSTAVTEGRDDVAQEADEQTDGRMFAIRTAKLDDNTCDPCEELHGERVVVGSKRYSLIAPPAECEGKHLCRCVWKYEQGGADSPSTDNAPVLEPLDRPDPYVQIFGWGTVQHPNGDFTVDEAFAEAMIAAFDWLREQYHHYPPILRQHKEDGYRYGEIRDLEVREDGIYALPYWIPQALRDVEAGKIDDISPSFLEEWTDPHSGKVLTNVLKEVSFVSDGHLMDIDPITQPDAAHTLSSTDQQETITMNDETENAEQPTDNMSEGPAEEDTEMMGGDDDREMMDGDDETEMMADSSSTFGGWLSGLVEEFSTPEGGPGPVPADHYADLAGDSEMSAEQLKKAAETGKLLFPGDDLLEAVADKFGLQPAKIRRGEVKGLGGSSGNDDNPDTSEGGGEAPDKPEQPEQPMAPKPTDNARDDEYMTQLERRVVQADLKAMGVDPSGEDIEGLTELHRSAPQTYQQAIEAIPTGEDTAEPTDNERGQVGASTTDSGNLRQCAKQAKEAGIEDGKPLVKHLKTQGFGGDEIDDEVIQKVYE